MGKTKKTESKFIIWLKNLQEKRRVVVLDEGSFEEKRNFTTSKFSLLLFFLFSIISRKYPKLSTSLALKISAKNLLFSSLG